MSTFDQNRVIVLAVLEMGLTPREAARRFNVSRQWVHVLLGRYREFGEGGLEPRSRRPNSHPAATAEDVRTRIKTLRAELEAAGLDAGAESIADRLQREGLLVPSVSTIWRTSAWAAITTTTATMSEVKPRSSPAQPNLAIRLHPLGPARGHRHRDHLLAR